MHFSQLSFILLLLLFVAFEACESQDCSYPLRTITVSQSDKADFNTIQSAIDSITAGNSQWIKIQISAGVYKEKVQIPKNKPCIYLEGAGSSSTSIELDSHLHLEGTVNVRANNTAAKGISFKNTLNHPVLIDEVNNITQAVALQVQADKCAFFDCAFYGVQDTLFDNYGRHYYHNCYIQGGIDFIFGDGQTIFEASTLNFSRGNSGSKGNGVFIAQRRRSPNETSGYVIKNCTITGTGGQAELGRALDPYARVIVANSYLSDVVVPHGWNANTYIGHEETLTFVEEGNRGPGADKSKRVKWLKHLSGAELDHFLNISYIDQEGWIANLPMKISK